MVALLLSVAACSTSRSGTTATPKPRPAPVSTTGPSPTPRPGIVRATHVFLIVMENKAVGEALSQPYVASLAARYGSLTDYHAVAHPSAPNYLALTSGSTWGRHDDSYVELPHADIGQQLTDAGLPWRAYMEDLPGDCRQSTGQYAVKHDPFAYYGGACPPEVVPLSDLGPDLGGSTPTFVWITPNLCHDTHDCPVSVGDTWLRSIVPQIMASSAWQHGGVLFITWDEDDGSADNHIATLVISPSLRPTDPAAPYTHLSLLATIEDLLGVPRLATVASTPAISLCC